MVVEMLKKKFLGAFFIIVIGAEKLQKLTNDRITLKTRSARV